MVVVERSLGVDTIALVAMVGSLVLNQELAGVMIGLMFSGGRVTLRARRGFSPAIDARCDHRGTPPGPPLLTEQRADRRRLEGSQPPEQCPCRRRDIERCGH